jgi:hypothetical protein
MKEKTGVYLAKEVDIQFFTVEEKNNFDKWFYNQHFENTPVEDIIEAIDDYLVDGELDFDCVFGTGKPSEQEENYICSVYKYRFGDNWYEERTKVGI